MRIAIIGGTGFVGSYISGMLLERGHALSLLVRPGSEDKAVEGRAVRQVSGDIDSEAAIVDLVKDADVVIYLVGILREQRGKGVTFERTQEDGVRRCVDVAQKAGVQRFVLMSANGVEAAKTDYQRTKLAAEHTLAASGLAHTILRPSVIFGDPHGRMEFATQLFRQMVKPPLPAVGFHRGWPWSRAPVVMSPVHVDDVALAFVLAAEAQDQAGAVHELGGPEVLSWVQIIRRIAAATGRRKIVLPMPLGVMKFAALLLDWIPLFPATYDQLDMLEQGNTCDPAVLQGLTGRAPKAMDGESLAYLTNESTDTT